jgi:hypothetical protein
LVAVTDPRPYPDTDDDAEVGSERESATSPPRWSRTLGIVVVVIVISIFVVLHLTGTLGSGAH